MDNRSTVAYTQVTVATLRHGTRTRKDVAPNECVANCAKDIISIPCEVRVCLRVTV